LSFDQWTVSTIGCNTDDKISLQATAVEVTDPVMKPDRLMTALTQIRKILAGK